MWLWIPLIFLQLAPPANVPTFRSSINEVVLDVQVLDATSNRPIPGLGSDDFEVLDNGLPVDLASFHQGTLPLDVVLAIDVSGGFAHNGARIFSEELFRRLASGDRVGVVSFARRTRRRLPLTDNAILFRNAIQKTFREDRDFATTSCLYDGLWDAAQMLDSVESRRRRVVLALTHDREGRSRRKADEIVRTLLESAAHFEGVAFTQTRQKRKMLGGFGGIGARTYPPSSPPETEVLPSLNSMRPIVEKTGGLVSVLDDPVKRSTTPSVDEDATKQAQLAAEDLLSRLRAVYRMTFPGQLSDELVFRGIEVRLTTNARAKYPNAVVFSRSAYLAGPQER